MATKIASNGGYSWWCRPLFLQAPTHLYFTSIANSDKARAFRNDSTDFVELCATTADDHNAPVILARPNKARHTFGTRHAANSTVKHFKATSGINFVEQDDITHPDNTITYVQAIDYEDKIAIFSRSGADNWRFRISTDWGETWGTSRRIINFDDYTDRKYMLLTPSSTTGVYHMAAYGHPTASNWRGMVYGVVDFRNGDISNAAGVVANLDGTNLPLTETSLDDIVPTTGSEIARLFDVGEAHGRPVILYAKWDDENEIQPTYWYAYRDDEGEWQHMGTGVLCGASFYASSRYYGGMSIDKTGDQLALAREENGTSYIDLYPINSNMTLGSKTELASNSEKRLVRPYFVEDSHDLVWQELREYDHFTDYTIWYWKEDL